MGQPAAPENDTAHAKTALSAKGALLPLGSASIKPLIAIICAPTTTSRPHARHSPCPARALPDSFFDRDAQTLARDLLGKVIRHRQGNLWLAARIIETEAYYLTDKGSHASLGYTESARRCSSMVGTSTCTTPAAATR